MITVKQALEIHQLMVNQFGGATGVRDFNGLESALARPFQSFGGEELYPDYFSKAAAIGESIIINHPFNDGNKRTGYVLMESILRHGNLKINADDAKLYDMVISIATGDLRFDAIVKWLKQNTTEI